MRFAAFVAKMVFFGAVCFTVNDYAIGQVAADAHGVVSGVEVLTDTQGVDFGPYLKVVLGQFRAKWIGLLPAEAHAPENASSLTVIRFTIEANGTVSAMRLERSDRKVNFDRAAWGAIAQSGALPELPANFTGNHLDLRINFAVNEKPTATQP